ncbi:MAG: hypothetical protein CL908_24320 [Deltaproteobacteria bacterium]|nr:hypothetical protein [Deltaproteobacteria bacterium]
MFLLAIFMLAVFFVYIKDPCNQQVRTDFSNEYPSFKILNSGVSDGSPESVRCHVSYEKPASEQVYEDIWLYQHTDRGWEFVKIVDSRKMAEPG